MSVLVNKNSKIIVQGFTGAEGTFHSEQMIGYNSKAIVGGVTPGKGGTEHLGKLVFNTVEEAVKKENADTSIIFVPPAFASDAIMEAVEAGIKVIICITEGIPVQDMVKVKKYMEGKECRLIGPNCPGIITPGEAKVGIMPANIHKKGSIGIISRSGTLTYEAVDQVTKKGLGQSTCIGIGGDSIPGTTTKDAVELLMNDIENWGYHYDRRNRRTNGSRCCSLYKRIWNKASCWIYSGVTAPKGRTMGHAGAIVGGAEDTAEAKIKIMEECGITIAHSPADIGNKIVEVLNKNK